VATKFGGCSPWVSDTYKWPQCHRCLKPQAFLLQINLADLPPEFKSRTKLSSGLFQLFDCIACFKYSYGTDFGCLRMIDEKELSVGSLQFLAAVASKDLAVGQLPNKLQKYVEEVWSTDRRHPHWGQAAPTQIFEERFVMNWEENEVSEIPDSDEWEILEAATEKLGVEAQVIHDTKYNKVRDKEGANELKMGGPSSGTKMGGWFDWDSSLGYPGYPDCENCLEAPKMDQVFMQITFSELVSSCQEEAAKSNHEYTDIVFLVLCPKCHKPAIFECFPPPLEARS